MVWSMPRELVLTRHLVVILSVWVCAWGMAAVDLFDLTDELLQPLASFGQIVEPELDELGDEGLNAAVALTSVDADGRVQATGVSSSVAAQAISSLRPPYLKLAQYRI